MNYKAIKRFIVSSSVSRWVDLHLRRGFSIFPILHSIIFRRSKPRFNPDLFVLFVNGGIGDCAMQIPLINILRLHCEVLVIVPEHSAPLLSVHAPDIKTVVYNGQTKAFDLLAKTRRILRKNSIFVFTSSIVEIYAFFLALRVPAGYGLIGDNKALRPIGLNLKSTQISSTSKVEIFAAIGDDLIRYFYGQDTEEPVTTLRESPFFDSKYVVIAPNKTSEWPAGRWMPERFSFVADFLVDKYGVKVVFVGSPKERSYVNTVMESCRNNSFMHNSSGETTLEGLHHLLSGASFVLSNDSGIMHMAALSKTPCVALFSFSDPKVYAWPSLTFPIFKNTYNCMPCVSFNQYPIDNYPFKCPYNSRCDMAVLVDDVLIEIESLVSRGVIII